MGYFDLNNKNLGSKSILHRKASLITNYIIELINGTIDLNGYDYQDNYKNYSQNIKKLISYDTDNPLGLKGMMQDGKIISQPIISDSLLKDSTQKLYYSYTDINGVKQSGTLNIIRKQALFSSSFNIDMSIQEQNYIFVHNYRNTPTKNSVMGDMYFRIDIIIPDKYDNILDVDSGINIKKGDSLLFNIEDMITDHTIEVEKYANYTGNVKFMYIDSIKDRLANTSGNIIYSILYKVTTCNMKVDDY